MNKYNDFDDKLFQLQKRSRKSIDEGDIFTYKLSSGDYLFARVISTKADQYPPTGEPFIMVYLFNAQSKDLYDIPKLNKNNLLIPPYLTVKQEWSRGYAFTVKKEPLTKNDVHMQHYFFNPIFNIYNDGFGNISELEDGVDPLLIGRDGLGSIAILDWEIRKALEMEIPKWSENWGK